MALQDLAGFEVGLPDCRCCCCCFVNSTSSLLWWAGTASSQRRRKQKDNCSAGQARERAIELGGVRCKSAVTHIHSMNRRCTLPSCRFKDAQGQAILLLSRTAFAAESLPSLLASITCEQQFQNDAYAKACNLQPPTCLSPFLALSVHLCQANDFDV